MWNNFNFFALLFLSSYSFRLVDDTVNKIIEIHAYMQKKSKSNSRRTLFFALSFSHQNRGNPHIFFPIFSIFFTVYIFVSLHYLYFFWGNVCISRGLSENSWVIIITEAYIWRHTVKAKTAQLASLSYDDIWLSVAATTIFMRLVFTELFESNTEARP